MTHHNPACRPFSELSVLLLILAGCGSSARAGFDAGTTRTSLWDGGGSAADASSELPDGTAGALDGSVESPDGSTGAPDGSVESPDGSTGSPDASTGSPDGSVGVDGGASPAFFNNTPDWAEPFASTLDPTVWTAELTASGEGNSEFELYNGSAANLTIKTDSGGHSALYIYPGLADSYVIGPGQAVANSSNSGASPPNPWPAPGTVASMPGALTSGDLTNPEILGCGRTAVGAGWETSCPGWGEQPFYLLDLGTGCTDDGSAYGQSWSGCVLGSGFYVFDQTPGCTGTCPAYWSILPPVTSARISTKAATTGIPAGGFQYGRLEIRAKIPRGDWLWPALWMLPVNQTGTVGVSNPSGTGAYGTWPRSGEIDILESRGNTRACSEAYENQQADPSQSAVGGVQSFSSTLHWGPYYTADEFAGTHTELSVPAASATLDNDFHIYGLRWNSTGLYTYIDNDSNHVLEVSFANQSFYSRATGGSYSHCLKNTESSGGYDCTGTQTVPPVSVEAWSSAAPAPDVPVQQLWTTNAAPFDQPFYLIMNVAVGGTNGYFPDGWCDKPWTTSSSSENDYPVADFYGAMSQWFSPGTTVNGAPNNTWSADGSSVSDDAALQVEEVRYWEEPAAGAFGALSASAVQ